MYTDEVPNRSRKRAASTPPAGEDQDGNNERQDTRRARQDDDLDNLGLIDVEDAWNIDLDDMLEGNLGAPETVAGAERQTRSPQGGAMDVMTGVHARVQTEIIVLCVLGQLDGQYWLLCALLAPLRTIAPALRAFALCNNVEGRRQRLLGPSGQTSWAYLGPRGAQMHSDAMAFVQPSNPGRTFTRMGLMHPMGGGKEPLDAIVVVDRRGEVSKRRLVLPFGWGAGKFVQDGAGGWMVRGRLMEVLRDSVEEIAREQRIG